MSHFSINFKRLFCRVLLKPLLAVVYFQGLKYIITCFPGFWVADHWSYVNSMSLPFWVCVFWFQILILFNCFVFFNKLCTISHRKVHFRTCLFKISFKMSLLFDFHFFFCILKFFWPYSFSYIWLQQLGSCDLCKGHVILLFHDSYFSLLWFVHLFIWTSLPVLFINLFIVNNLLLRVK